jgi:hypothetical protein
LQQQVSCLWINECIHLRRGEHTMTRALKISVVLITILLGNASMGLAETCGPGWRRFEQDNRAIKYTGNWYANAQESNSSSSATLTNAKGSRAVISFVGMGIAWIGLADRYSGYATVILDGSPRSVSTYSYNPMPQHILFQARGLPYGIHTLSIEITHERDTGGEGSWVWIDAFEVENGTVISDLVTAATGRVEESGPALVYTGKWYSNSNAAHSGGNAVLTIDAGSSVTINFNGTGIAWVTQRDSWSGIARVYLDDELKMTIDTYLTPGQAQAVPFRIDGLPRGNHTLRIEATGSRNESSGGAWVWVDAFDVSS